jgi:CHAT domain-containing protein
MTNDMEYKKFIVFVLETSKTETHPMDNRPARPSFTNFGYDMKMNIQALYIGVFKPLNVTGFKKIIISPDQNISALPFEILPQPNNKLIMEDYKISYVPSAKIFNYLRANKERPQNYNSFFGLSFNDNRRLEYTDIEVKTIAPLFGKSKIASNCTETDIYESIREINSFDILHFSTHNNTLIQDESFKSTYLQYCKDAKNDGQLTPSEIAAKLKNKASLVTLSGCETAPSADIKQFFNLVPLKDTQNSLTEDEISGSNSKVKIPFVLQGGCVCSYGETFSSLTSAFMSAGASKLILTQWPVSAEASKRFFEVFYRNLYEYKEVFLALNKTRQEFKNTPITNWGSFIIISD